MPGQWDPRSYRHKAKREAFSLVAGGGGGMQQLGREVGAAAVAAASASGLGQAGQTTAAFAGAAVQGGLGQATAAVSTKEHLFQTGEYLLQDAALSEPFDVNAMTVLGAYLGFARQTGCRPGMCVNDTFDHLDKNSKWFDTSPLRVSSLRIGGIGEDGLRIAIGPGGNEASIWLEVTFGSSGQ